MNGWRFKRRVHVSWLIAWLCVGLVSGAGLAQGWSGFHSLAWPIIAIVTCGIVMWRKVVLLVPLIVLAGVLFGLWRGSIGQDQLRVYQQLYGSSPQIRGSVIEDVDTDAHGMVTMRLGAVTSDGHPLPGKLWVTAQTKYDVKRGDTVTVKGKLKPGFGNFAGALYRAKVESIQRPEPGDVARVVRDWFADHVRMAIHDPAASLGIGYLVGQKRGLPEELAEALKIAGLTHVVVASGYNLTILVRLARRFFERVSKYLATLSASLLILSFMAVTGSSPSMSRAGLVAGLSLAAWYYGRSFHPLVLLPFAAAITVLIDPSYAWNDLGWQLSFAAFAGVMILAPLLQRYFFGDKKPGTVRQILGETIAAHIVTLPILVAAFGVFSNVAVFANVLVLPFVPLAMLLTFIAGVGTLVIPAIAPLVGLPAQWLLDYMIWIATYLAKLPWAQTEFAMNGWGVAIVYALLLAVCMWLMRATKYNLRESNIIE